MWRFSDRGWAASLMRSPSCLLWYVACALCDQTEGEVFSELCILLLPVHIINQSSQHLSTYNDSIAQFTVTKKRTHRPKGRQEFRI